MLDAQSHNTPVTLSSQSNRHARIALILEIWRGKWIIIVCILIALAATGGYCAVTKERWTSTAIVTLPDTAQIAPYAHAMVLLGDVQSHGSNVTPEQIIQLRVFRRFRSLFAALSASLLHLTPPEQLTIISEGNSAKLPLRLSYQGYSAKEAQHKLAQYIQMIDQQITAEITQDLTVNIDARLKELSASLATQEKIAQEQQALRFKQIAHALTITRTTIIMPDNMQQMKTVSQDMLYLLGSRALESMIKNQKSAPLVFPEKYYLTRARLLNFQALDPHQQKIHVYRAIMKPTLPLLGDGLQTELIITLAVLSGVVVGSGIIISRYTLQKYHPTLTVSNNKLSE